MENPHDEEKKSENEIKKQSFITEGLAKVLIETMVNISSKEENYQAFYNPVQVCLFEWAQLSLP